MNCDLNLNREMPKQFDDANRNQLKFIHDYLYSLIFEGEPSQIFPTPFLKNLISKLDHAVKDYQNSTK